MGQDVEGEVRPRGFALQEQVQRIVARAMDGPDTGGVLITAPTGSGKTTAVAREIARRVVEDPESRFIYVSPTKANRNEFFERVRGELPEGLAQVVYNVESNADVASRLDPSRLRPEAVAEELREPLRAYSDARQVYDFFSAGELADSLKRDFMNSAGGPRRRLEQAEGALRKATRRALERECSERNAEAGEQRWTPLELVERDEGWAWVRSLWPQSETVRKRVLIMTPEKLYYPHDTIVTGTIRFIDPKYLSECVTAIILDESDAIKGSWLSLLISESVDVGVDAVEAVARIARALERVPDPSRLSSLRLLTSMHPNEASRFQQLREDLGRLYDREHLESHYKIDEGLVSYSDRSFVFSSVGGTLFSTSGSSMSVIPEEGANRIVPKSSAKAKGQPGAGGEAPTLDINVTVDACTRALRRFCYMVGDWAEASVNLKRSIGAHGAEPRGKGYEQTLIEIDEVGTRKKVSSILADLGLFDPGDALLRTKLTEAIMAQRIQRRLGRHEPDGAREALPTGFYSEGATLYEFRDDDAHESITSMTRYALTMTPETILASILTSTRALMVSATAEIDSVNNVPIAVLRDTCDLIDDIPAPERERLRALNDEENARRRGLYRVEVGVVADDCALSLPARVGLAMPGLPEAARLRVSYYLGQATTLGGVDVSRYLFLCRAFSDFVTSPESESALVFLSRFPKSEPGRGYTLETLMELLGIVFDAWLSEGRVAGGKRLSTPPQMLRLLRASDWERGMEAVRADLAQGMPAFVLTSYSTAEMGKNPQYVSSPETAAASVSLGFGDGSRDFDFMALEEPTYVLLSGLDDVGGGTDGGRRGAEAEDMMRLLYEQRSLAETGEISMGAMKGNMVMAARGGNFRIHHLPSFRNWVLRKVMQATGRGNRSGLKARVVRILLTQSLAEDVSAASCDDIPLTYEMGEVLAACGGVSATPDDPTRIPIDPDLERMSNLFTTNTAKAKGLVGRLVHTFRDSEAARDRYLAIGDFLMRHPTLPDPSREDMRRYGLLYARLPGPAESYSYSRSTDSDRALCYLGGVFPERVGEGSFEVSAASTGLADLMRVPLMTRWWESHGLATRFDAAELVMNPCAASDLYKGRLGEQAFAAVWDSIAKGRIGMPRLVDDLSEGGDLSRFEKFDFELKGTGVYVDAKNFRSFDKRGEEFDRYLAHVREKMVELGAREVIFVNAIHPGDSSLPKRIDMPGTGRLLIVPGLVRDGELDGNAIRLIIEEVESVMKGDGDAPRP